MKMIDGYLKIETKAGWVKHILKCLRQCLPQEQTDIVSN